MDKDHPSNIFDAAANSGKERKNKPASPRPLPAEKAKSFDDKNVEGMLVNMDKMRREIQRKIEEIYEKSGVSQKELEDYLSNPNNFNQAEWTRVQANRDRFLEKIWQAVGKDKKKKIVLKEKKKQTKKRKGKMLGHRKGWLPMR